ncbi:MAG: chemotaxis protein CheW [Terriglobales bacterium]
MKIVSSEFRSRRQQRHTEAVILFAVAGQAFAIAASAIDEIRSTDSFSSAASEIAVEGMPEVRHRLRRGRRWCYVVNACAHFDLPVSRPTLVLVLRNSRVAVLVDHIDRIETISRLMAIPQSFSGQERVWYRGLTLIDDNVVPVLSPFGFLTESEIMQLDALDASAATSAQSEVVASQDETHGAFR